MDDFEQQKEGIFDLINSWDEKNIRIATLIWEANPSLKEAIFDSFKHLIEAKNYKNLPALRLLANLNAIKSDDFQEEIKYCTNIRWLKINHTNLSLFPDIYLRDLEQLKIQSGLITELPTSIGNLKSLRFLELSGCQSLRLLPPSMKQLNNLQHLNLSGTFVGNQYQVNILNTPSQIQDFFKNVFV